MCKSCDCLYISREETGSVWVKNNSKDVQRIEVGNVETVIQNGRQKGGNAYYFHM